MLCFLGFWDVLWAYVIGSAVSRPVSRSHPAVAANVVSLPLVVVSGLSVPQTYLFIWKQRKLC